MLQHTDITKQRKGLGTNILSVIIKLEARLGFCSKHLESVGFFWTVYLVGGACEEALKGGGCLLRS